MYGARCMEYLSSEKWVKPFMVVYALVAIVGATMDLGMLWSIAETFNGLMAIPNLIALFLLSGTVVKLVKDYFARLRSKSSLVSVENQMTLLSRTDAPIRTIASMYPEYRLVPCVSSLLKIPQMFR